MTRSGEEFGSSFCVVWYEMRCSELGLGYGRCGERGG